MEDRNNRQAIGRNRGGRASAAATRTGVAALIIFIAGCATVGEIPIQAELPETVYISPANQDEVQDSVTIPAEALPLERTVLKGYRVTVLDQEGKTIYLKEESVPRQPLLYVFDRNRRAEQEVPDYILWDGRDTLGDYAPDDTYRLTVEAWDNRGNTGQSDPQSIVVDNTAPRVDAWIPVGLFSPDGDGRLDTVAIYQRDASSELGWVGQILRTDGTIVREYRWEQVPVDVEWDGADDEGNIVPDGVYTYRVATTDLAGNATEKELSGIVVDTADRPTQLATDRRVFSPNGDGRADTVTVTPTVATPDTLKEWRMEVRNVRGAVVGALRGAGAPVPYVFDGKDRNGETLPDGPYRAVLFVEYANGQTADAPSSPIVIDTRPPNAVLSVDRNVFSPDGDGRRDTIRISQFTTREREWTAQIESSGGEVVRTYAWQGRADELVWDGNDAVGSRVPDGTYKYVIRAVDEAENPAEPAELRLRVDTQPTPVRIQVTPARFSPNGDGLSDTATAALDATVIEGIETWSVEVIDARGEVRAKIAQGEESVPAAIVWHGRGAAGASGRSDGNDTFEDGSYRLRFAIAYEKGNLASALSGPITIDSTAPDVSLSAVPARFSPDGDGSNDTLTFSLSAADRSSIQSWNLLVTDPTGTPFRSFRGTGAPPQTVRWDGRGTTGELVQSATAYNATLTATDVVWNAGSGDAEVSVDIMVVRQVIAGPEGEEREQLRISLSNIHFPPFSADFAAVPADQVAENLATIDRLAEVLKRYPTYQIAIEGHAVMVYWNQPARAQVEQDQVLIPLSQARADAIRAALAARGISDRRMTVRGYGGARPIVPHGDLTNRWKNRRVEFVLVE